MLAWVLFWLARSRERQLGLEERLEARQQALEALLHEQERRLAREQTELRDLLSERIARGALAQQRLLHTMQQTLSYNFV